MTSLLTGGRTRLKARATTMLLLLGVMALVPLDTASQSGPPPTVGDIVVDGFDCATGVLSYHVPVTNLPHVPDPDLFDEPLANRFLARYTQGPFASPLPEIYNPPAQQAPYTGIVSLTSPIPLANDRADTSDPVGTVTSIEITVYVGYVTAFDNPTDTSTTTYTVDCGDGTSLDELIRQIIAIIEQILAGL